MKVVIVTVSGCRNRGVEALVDSLIDQLLSRDAAVEITVLTRDLRFDASRAFAQRATVLDEPLVPGRTPALKRNAVLRTLTKPLQNEGFLQALELIAAADLVISTGGDCFSSDYGDPEHWLFGLRLALDLGTPVYFLGQSIGVFRDPAHARAWAEVAERSHTTLRESRSLRYCREDLGVTADRLEWTADPAFLLPHLEAAEGEQLRRGLGMDAGPTVALGVSRGVSNFAGADHSEHVRAWLATIRMVLDDFRAQVLLVPHVSTAIWRGDDAALATELWRALDYDPRVRVMAGDYSAREFKTAIAGCELVVAERMHACIAGLSSGVTTVSVGYSIKAEGIMEDLLGAGVGDAGLLLSLQEFMDSDPAGKAQGAIRDAWANRSSHAAELREALPAVRERASRNFDVARDLVGNRS